MTYGDIRDTTLKLINQYTRIGNKINLTYNEQDDVVNRIPAFANDAQLIIARGPRPIEASFQLDPRNCRDLGANLMFTLPEDLIDIQPGGLLIIDPRGPMTRSSELKQLDDDHIIVPAYQFYHGNAVMLQYYRRPQLLSDNPADDDPMDNVITAQEPIPYYCAAQIALTDNEAYEHSVLFNMWQDKLNELAKPPQAEHNIVQDVYSAHDSIWDWGVT